MNPPRSKGTDAAALTPRRQASIRRLIVSGIGIMALLAIGDFIFNRHAGRAMLHGGLIAIISGVWWLSRHTRTPTVLTASVYLELLPVSIGSSVSLYFDSSGMAGHWTP